MKRNRILFVFVLGLVVSLFFSNNVAVAGNAAAGWLDHKETIDSAGLTDSSGTSTKPSKPSKPSQPSKPKYVDSYVKKITEFSATLNTEKDFYELDDEIILSGKRDIVEFSKKSVVKGTENNDTTPPGKAEDYYKVGSGKEAKYRYYTNITFEGFRVEVNGEQLDKTIRDKSNTEYFSKSYSSSDDWQTKKMKISELIFDELEYDDNGVAIGRIKVQSTHPDKRSKTFEFRFNYREVSENSDFDATVFVNGVELNENGGLYQPGDVLKLVGTRCTYDVYREKFSKNGSVEKVKTISLYNGVKIEFQGFELEKNGTIIKKDLQYNKNLEIDWKDYGYDYESYESEFKDWATGEYKIKKVLDSALYDAESGVHYGKIILTSDDPNSEQAVNGICRKEFKIYFGDPIDPFVPVDVTVKLNPTVKAGTVTLSYLKYVNETEYEEVKDEMVVFDDQRDLGYNIKILKGSSITIKPNPNEGFVYRDITNIHGNILSGSKGVEMYNTPKINEPTTYIVNFEKDKEPGKGGEEGYTLYVTSTEGGNAWVVDERVSTEKSETENRFGSEIYTVHGVRGGEKFTLYYETAEGYEFEKWEYRPRIKSDSLSGDKKEGSVNITMPYSDLTATAVFKKVVNEKPENNKYTLKITSNNEVWGDAWAYIEGEWKYIGELEAGEECIVYFEANPGYYFTNWDYDSLESPFIEVNKETGFGKIIMPENNLEIKAFFSPIPEPGENPENPKDPDYPTPPTKGEEPEPDPNPDDINSNNLHAIYFVGELETRCDGLGGTVPENLSGVRGGAKITMAVTPYQGYEFVRWYFTKAESHVNGNHDAEGIITPDSEDTNGSGSFIMPDYDVVAHAVFREETASKKITIIIIGEGTVRVEEIPVESEGEYNAKPGATIDIKADPDDEWKFINVTDKDGKIVSEDPNFDYKMPNKDVTLFVNFAKKGPYTLYVTSMFGGNAFTEGNKNHPKDEVIITKDDHGKYTYKIEEVYAGEEFEIRYNITEDGYTFDKWEYRPFIQEADEGMESVKITMPHSDLTVTAIFKNNELFSSVPKLTVTTNNTEWGSAGVGENLEEYIKKDAISGDEYLLKYESKEGYYFTNWKYSTSNSPFEYDENLPEDQAKIIMPDRDLEIIAIFAPIPGYDDNNKVPGNKIDFKAEPITGGSVPEDLDNIKPGSKVTIAVTPNAGWTFDYWYFKNSETGEIISPDSYWDTDGTGYFIMPDYPIDAIAVFKRIGNFNLYITYTAGGRAWTYDSDRNEVTHIPEAIYENLYDIACQVDDDYEFVEWVYKFDDEIDTITNPGIHVNGLKGKIVMPRSDMTVTAVFKKKVASTPTLRVTSNNYLWGDAYVYIDGIWRSWKGDENSQHTSNDPAIEITAGTEIEVKYEAYTNYEFVEWRPTDDFVNYPDKGEVVATIIMPDHDLELMAYFKPGSETYTLTLKSNIEDADAILSGDGKKEKNSICDISVEDYDSTNYTFIGWKDLDGNLLTKKENYIYGPIKENTVLIAYFEEKDNGDKNGVSDYYNVTIYIDGEGNVNNLGKGETYTSSITNRLYKEGTKLTLIGSAKSGWEFVSCEINNIPSSFDRVNLTVNKDLSIRFKFAKEGESITADRNDFKIISVRDLRWQDYFVDSNGNLKNTNEITVPSEDRVMLSNVSGMSSDKENLKMGYAVEFELMTTTYDHNNAVLLIEPVIYANGEEIKWNNIKDALTGKEMNNDYMTTVKDFSKVIIVHNTAGKANAKKLNDTYKASYQTSSIYDSSATNNGISTERIVWRWLYYLPAKLEGINGDNITIAFKVSVHDMKNDFTAEQLTTDTKKYDLVTYLGKYKRTKWTGDVYKYSLSESLLDDIYNNAN